jgi:two-component system, OmpR family, KDP operon response regulator KdpE
MTLGKILLIDNEPKSRHSLASSLSAAGYDVEEASGEGEGLRRIRAGPPDLIVLDSTSPDVDGKAVCHAIREMCSAPIVILSFKSGEREKVEALNSGADDFLAKPYSMDELIARVRAILRRSANRVQAGPRQVALGDLYIDFETRRVRVKECQIHLTPKEFDLLGYLVAHAGQPIPHRKLLHAVWGPNCENQLSYLRVFVNQIRRKIEPDASNPKYLVTEPWFGYRFVLPD